MKYAPSSHIRRLLLLVLLSFTLLGVQLVQNSPLHNHLQHSVDCALCHFQLSDDTEYAAPAVPSVAARPPYRAFTLVLATSSLRVAPYQSRAPPVV